MVVKPAVRHPHHYLLMFFLWPNKGSQSYYPFSDLSDLVPLRHRFITDSPITGEESNHGDLQLFLQRLPGLLQLLTIIIKYIVILRTLWVITNPNSQIQVWHCTLPSSVLWTITKFWEGKFELDVVEQMKRKEKTCKNCWTKIRHDQLKSWLDTAD